ncbi:MAG: purine-binding chemotaxis protein CheW [Gemmatimonadetes bacterium]|nr:purine-binding chemotaxis protein CheW [Gemmatimonadota bacterium]
MTETMAPAELQAEQYLTFVIGAEPYAVGILQVREILRYEAVTPVPTAPPAVRGVLNLRGRVVPVVDPAIRFGRGPSEITRLSCIVIVETVQDGEAYVMGLLVDAVSQVLELGPADIEPVPAFGSGVRVDFLRGLARQGNRFALLLDLDRVLDHSELTPELTEEAVPVPA